MGQPSHIWRTGLIPWEDIYNPCSIYWAEHQILSIPFTITRRRVKLRFMGACNSSFNCCSQRISSLDGFFSLNPNQVFFYFNNNLNSCIPHGRSLYGIFEISSSISSSGLCLSSKLLAWLYLISCLWQIAPNFLIGSRLAAPLTLFLDHNKRSARVGGAP